MKELLPFTVPVIIPLLDGVARKIRARIQDRIGPPVLQTWYDLLSLLEMESIQPVESAAFRIAPYLAFGSALTMLFLIPWGEGTPLGIPANVIAFLYFFTLFSASVVMGGLSVRSSYTASGAGREISLSMVFKPAFAVVIAVLALKTGSLDVTSIARSVEFSPSVIGAYILLIYLTYVEAGFIPYDIAEAETEILGGVLSEYSGRALAAFLWAFQVKRFAMLWLLSAMFVLPFADGSRALILQSLVTLAIFVLMVVYESMNARYRVDQALRRGAKALIVGFILLVLAFAGW